MPNRRDFLGVIAAASGVIFVRAGLTQPRHFTGSTAGEEREVSGVRLCWCRCRNWYHPRLPGGTDPDLYEVKGTPNRDGTYSRVRRGGAWIEEGWTCRSAFRLRYEPERSSDHIGCRVVAVQL